MFDIGFIKVDLIVRKIGRLVLRIGDGVLVVMGEEVFYLGGGVFVKVNFKFCFLFVVKLVLECVLYENEFYLFVYCFVNLI